MYSRTLEIAFVYISQTNKNQQLLDWPVSSAEEFRAMKPDDLSVITKTLRVEETALRNYPLTSVQVNTQLITDV